MMELLRNCAHGSCVSLYLRDDPGTGRSIIKCAPQEGISALKRELAGWQWYVEAKGDVRHGTPRAQIKITKDFARLQLPFIAGKKPNFRDGVAKNERILRRIIEHYCSIWPSVAGNLAPLHGDLSLDNVILSESDDIWFIDWEHFAPEAIPWGFDAIYLIVETMIVGMGKKFIPSRREMSVACSLLGRLSGNHASLEVPVQHPLAYLRKIFHENEKLWDGQLQRFPEKFPVLVCGEEQTRAIDEVVAREIRRTIDNEKFVQKSPC